MNNEYLNKAITLSNGEKYAICDETIQNDNKYYLAVKLDENNQIGDESKIFKEVIKNGKVLFDDKIDEETYKYLTAIFIMNFNNNIDKIKEDLDKEEV